MENSIYSLLVKQNPWWIKEKIDNPKAFLPKRDVFLELKNLLGKPRILALIGPRRTGKTVLVFQLIKYLLEEKKVKPENICYLLCDDPEVELFLLESNFGKIIEGFLDQREGLVYIFLDEIQYILNWSLWLKKYYEFNPKIKFIITGSSALHLQKGSRESLVGRLLEKIILPLSFSEYVRIKNQLSGGVQIPKVLPQSTFLKTEYFISHKTGFYKRKSILETEFENFLLRGGFPEGLFEKDISLWQEYLKEDVIKRQVYHDIVKIFKIENPSLLENLLFYIGTHSSSLFSFETFLNALPFGSKETVINYLSYLKETFLINSLTKFSKKGLIKKKKYFLTDSGLINMIVKRKSLLGQEEFLGHLVESVTQNQSLNKNPDCFFYRDEKGREVDLIIKEGGNIIPIEIKYQEKINKNDLLGLLYFLEKYCLNRGLVLTKEKVGKERIGQKIVYYLPVWEFLY